MKTLMDSFHNKGVNSLKQQLTGLYISAGICILSDTVRREEGEREELERGHQAGEKARPQVDQTVHPWFAFIHSHFKKGLQRAWPFVSCIISR